jgi:hypothetical protein
MGLYNKFLFIFLVAFAKFGVCQQTLGPTSTVNDTERLVAVLQSKPEYGGLIDVMREVDLLEASGAPKKTIAAVVTGLIKRVQFVQKYSPDEDLDLVLAWCAARKKKPVKPERMTSHAAVYTGRSADELAVALSEKPEYSELFDLFVDVQVMLIEGQSVQKIGPAMRQLIARIEFVQKYAIDSLLTEVLTWCYAQKGLRKRSLAGWKKALIALAAVAVFVGAAYAVKRAMRGHQQVEQQVEREHLPGLEIGCIVRHNGELFHVVSELRGGYQLRAIADARVRSTFAHTPEWQVASQYRIITIPDWLRTTVREQLGFVNDFIMRRCFRPGELYQEYTDDRQWRVVSVISPMERFVRLVEAQRTGDTVQRSLRLSPLIIAHYGKDAQKNLSDLAQEGTCAICQEIYAAGQSLAVCTQDRTIQHIVGHAACCSDQLENCPFCRGTRANLRSWQYTVVDSWQERCTRQITSPDPADYECPVCFESLLNAGQLFVCLTCSSVVRHVNGADGCAVSSLAQCPLCREQDTSQIVAWTPPTGLTMQGGGGGTAGAQAGAGAPYGTAHHPSVTHRIELASTVSYEWVLFRSADVGSFYNSVRSGGSRVQGVVIRSNLGEAGSHVKVQIQHIKRGETLDSEAADYKIFAETNHTYAPLVYTPSGSSIEYERYARLIGAQGSLAGNEVWIYKKRL